MLRTANGCRVGITAPSSPGEFCAGKTQALGLFELLSASENVTAGEPPALRSGRDLAAGPGLAFPGCSGSHAALLGKRALCPGVGVFSLHVN